MALRLASAHKPRAVEKLAEALESAGRITAKDTAEVRLSVVTNSAQFRNVFVMRNGRGLSVIERKPGLIKGLVYLVIGGGGGNRISILTY